MKRIIGVLLGTMFAVTAAAQESAPLTQSAAPASSATASAKANGKQQIMMQLGQAQRAPSGATKYTTPSAATKLDNEQKKYAMKEVWKRGNSQYGATAGAQAAKADVHAPKADKPDLNAPDMRKAMSSD